MLVAADICGMIQEQMTMATIQISQAEYDDFMDEEDTKPFMLVQNQLNASTSIVSFTAAAKARVVVTTEPVVKRHWTEELELELAGDNYDDTGPGWAGRTAG